MLLRTVVSKQKAAIAVILCAFLMALATIWPMRLYHEEHAYASGLEPTYSTEAVTEEQDAGEYFVAQYRHLQTLKFYVQSVKTGEQAEFQLFHVEENGAMTLTAEETVELPKEYPAYAVVSVDADMITGDTYVYTVRGVEGSSFTVGCESQTEALATGKAPLYQLGFYYDSGVEDMAVKTSVTYRVPESKGPSILRSMVYFLLAAAAIAIVRLIGRRQNKGNAASGSVTTLLRVLQFTLTPVILVVFGLAFLAVWPGKLFDGRVLDILIYEAGIVIGGAFLLYGLWHRRVGAAYSGTNTLVTSGIAEVSGNGIRVAAESAAGTAVRRGTCWHWGIIVCIALILDRSAVYMNATNDYVHDASMHWIVALLCVIVLLMGDIASNCSLAANLVGIVSIVSAAVYCAGSCVGAEDAEAAWKNGVIISRSVACALAAIAVTATIVMLIDRVRSGRKPGAGICRSLMIPVAALAGWMLVFRNTRLWIPLMIGMWLLFYVKYRYWEGRSFLLEDLCKGVLLDFVCKMIYCMLHRYYLAYLYSRFSMHFHTPTVTAYYLIVACAASITLFVWRLRKVSGQRLSVKLAGTWKEAGLMGMSCSYMIMSLTRSGIGVMAVMLLIAAFYLGNYRVGYRRELPEDAADGMEGDREQSAEDAGRVARSYVPKFSVAVRLKTGVLTLLTFLLILCLSFPVAFTGQRLISTVYAHPERFEDLEPYDDWVLRNVTWNCTAFMNIEIFIRDFGDRIIGGEIGSKIYYGNDWYIPQGYRTADAGGVPDETKEYAGVLAADAENAASEAALNTENAKASATAGLMLLTSQAELEDGSIDTGDLSNGRIGLFVAYIKELNLTGHDEMGVLMQNGSMAVHAHNIFLQTAYDCGIPAGVLLLIAVCGMALAGLRYARRKGTKDNYALLPFLLTIGFGLTGMVEWIFHFSNPYTIAMLFALAPILFPEKETDR